MYVCSTRLRNARVRFLRRVRTTVTEPLLLRFNVNVENDIDPAAPVTGSTCKHGYTTVFPPHLKTPTL